MGKKSTLALCEQGFCPFKKATLTGYGVTLLSVGILVTMLSDKPPQLCLHFFNLCFLCITFSVFPHVYWTEHFLYSA